MATKTKTRGLEWIGNRWHCEGKPIHAGVGMELRGTDGERFLVRIESQDCGRLLIAYHDIHGLDFRYSIDPEYDRLRWPRE